DLDNNGKMEIVVSVSKIARAADGYLVATERQKILWWIDVDEKWSYTVGYPIGAQPSLGNIDSNKRKEIVFGLTNGTFYALNVSEDGKDVSLKWTYTVDEKYSAIYEDNVRGELGYTAIADIDLDGKNEIIFADSQAGLPDWDAELYVFNDNGNNYTEEVKISIPNGGAWGAPSIADIDGDGKIEIIVPTFYGVNVYEFSNGNLNLEWNNSHGRIEGSAVISDIDKDNEYEIVYTTRTYQCNINKTCYNRTYILNSSGGHDVGSASPIEHDIIPRVTPAVADIDNDGKSEIVITARNDENTELGKILCINPENGNDCSGSWPYSDNGKLKTFFVSPGIADINGDGDYNVIIAEKNGTKLHIINNDGTQLFDPIDVDGFIGSAPAIADLDNDGKAEIAVKRDGSPITILSTLSATNEPPKLSTISNITAIVGDLININSTGEVTATDSNNDFLTFYFSSPFNSSGEWQTTVNDTGNYSILVEASDGNLTDSQFVSVMVFNQTTVLEDQFEDNTETKTFDFTTAGNKTTYVVLPKNASILYTQLNLEGLAP
ncbi:VCBS repeat-containing protein, partial [Candidatus Woesearchaeota archaeon]|nr:VCBS repeat-containing protein [Candidatus Woesearchaeota archaeon]